MDVAEHPLGVVDGFAAAPARQHVGQHRGGVQPRVVTGGVRDVRPRAARPVLALVRQRGVGVGQPRLDVVQLAARVVVVGATQVAQHLLGVVVPAVPEQLAHEHDVVAPVQPAGRRGGGQRRQVPQHRRRREPPLRLGQPRPDRGPFPGVPGGLVGQLQVPRRDVRRALQQRQFRGFPQSSLRPHRLGRAGIDQLRRDERRVRTALVEQLGRPPAQPAQLVGTDLVQHRGDGLRAAQPPLVEQARGGHGVERSPHVGGVSVDEAGEVGGCRVDVEHGEGARDLAHQVTTAVQAAQQCQVVVAVPGRLFVVVDDCVEQQRVPAGERVEFRAEPLGAHVVEPVPQDSCDPGGGQRRERGLPEVGVAAQFGPQSLGRAPELAGEHHHHARRLRPADQLEQPARGRLVEVVRVVDGQQHGSGHRQVQHGRAQLLEEPGGPGLRGLQLVDDAGVQVATGLGSDPAHQLCDRTAGQVSLVLVAHRLQHAEAGSFRPLRGDAQQFGLPTAQRPLDEHH